MLKVPMLFCLVLGLGLSALSGCAASTPTRRAAVSLPDRPRQAVRIFDHEGNPTDWESMLAGVSGADVIVIGETHSHPLGLEAAACLWDDLLAQRSAPALLLEFFERDQQVALDDYLTGVTDEAAFRKAAGRNDGNYPPGHRRMVEAAKAAGRPVIAANAPRRYVRKTKADGYDDLLKLGPEQRRLFVVPDSLLSGRYRDDFFKLMSGSDHGMGGEGGEMPPEMIEKMYRSQQMWDATMADSIDRASLLGNRPAVLVVGRFHADQDGGTIQLLQRARPDLTVRSLSMVASDAQEIAEEDRGRADYVLYVGPGDDEGM
ncbi:MAG: ChaN family lipoprotein [Phycisphaerales bacterium]|nr:ChaN family lipoprotein [Phycisphaerales bacterium]